MTLKTKLQTKDANLVGTNDYTCWNEGYKGTAEPSVAKMSLLIFMTEANKQTLKP